MIKTSILIEIFTAIIKQANLATKADVYDKVEKTTLDDEPKKLNNKATSNKLKHVEPEM